MNKSYATVLSDGLGGVAVLECTSKVQEACKENGSPEAFHAIADLPFGVYKVEVGVYYESWCCDKTYTNKDYLTVDTGESVLIEDYKFGRMS